VSLKGKQPVGVYMSAACCVMFILCMLRYV